MTARGGPQRATKLVSHAWKSAFFTTVQNIILDATEPHAVEELSRDRLVARLAFPLVIHSETAKDIRLALITIQQAHLVTGRQHSVR